jgi:uncharacterized protein YecT (DUF1311 family)
MPSLRYALAAAALAVLGQAAPAAPAPSWLLTYAGKSTNELIWDKRAAGLIHESLPAALADPVQAGLGGPPDPVHVNGQRYVWMSACVPHACGEKGFLWVDTRTGHALGADADCDYPGEGQPWSCAITLGSSGLTLAGIPPQARQALRAWMTDQNLVPKSVAFAGPDGTQAVLDPAAYAPPARFRPPAGGPSFDCAGVSSPLETVICGDPHLARLDLELAQLYGQMRHGFASESDQRQLRDLQRQWVQHRNSRCLAAADRKACLAEEYQQQRETLGNWVPARGAR